MINKIIRGDCLEVMKGMEDNSVDLVLTDPPFKISQTYSTNVDADNLLAVSYIWPVAKELFRISKPGSYTMLYYDTRILPLLIYAMGNTGYKYLRGLTFYRRWGNAHKLYGWMSTSDFILLFRKPSTDKMMFYSKDWRHDVYVKAHPEESGANHPAQKPISDVEHMVKHLCPENGIVFDPYCGSGTTPIACQRANRKYIGIEISEEYCAIAEKRLNEEMIKTKLEL